MINLEKLDEAIAYIETHPEEHHQHAWFRRLSDGSGGWCRTTACLAGTIAVLDGWKPVFGSDVGEAHSAMVERAGRRLGPWEVAENLLDLTPDQSAALFLQADDLDDIKRVRAAILAGEL